MTLICGADWRAAAVLLSASFLWACGPAGCESGKAVCGSVRPLAGGGSRQVFQADFLDAKGVQHLRSVRILINGIVEGARACYIYYDRPGNAFLLVDDTGMKSSPLAAGRSGSVGNSQCRLDGDGSSASAAGNRLTVRLNLTFNPSFYGEKQIYLATDSVDGQSTALESSGSWTVP